MAASAPKKTTARKRATKSLPAVPAAVTGPTSVSDFRKKISVNLITLPSGNVVEVRRPGIQEFMASGIIPDSLTPLIQEMIAQGERKSPAQQAAQEKRIQAKMQEAISDPKKVEEMLRAMQRIAADSWVTPKLAFHQRLVLHLDTKENTWETIPREDRDEDTYLYTDEVDQEDLTFTFNYVSGGVADVERFRQQAGASVATVRGSSDLEVSS
jgi:hypothetical protein